MHRATACHFNATCRGSVHFRPRQDMPARGWERASRAVPERRKMGTGWTAVRRCQRISETSGASRGILGAPGNLRGLGETRGILRCFWESGGPRGNSGSLGGSCGAPGVRSSRELLGDLRDLWAPWVRSSWGFLGICGNLWDLGSLGQVLMGILGGLWELAGPLGFVGHGGPLGVLACRRRRVARGQGSRCLPPLGSGGPRLPSPGRSG